MAAVSSMGNNTSKCQKLGTKGEGKEAEIRMTTLCDLPDSILHEILSRLPIKEAIRTSVLSKKWEEKWTGVSIMELEEGTMETRQKFIDFVERILLACNPLRLKNLSLSFDAYNESPRVNNWLNGFLNPKMEELRLDLERVEQPLVFPEDFFTSETLTKFQLSMQNLFNFPPSTDFQNLRILTLKHVIFPVTETTQSLFSGCPSLEELTLIDCNWMNVRAVCIECPLLRKLIIREWKDDDEDSDSDIDEEENVPNMEEEAVLYYSQIVIIGTNNLKTFSYDGDLLNDYFLCCARSVIDAAVEVHQPDYYSVEVGFFVFKLLNALRNVQKLSITDFAAEALNCAPINYCVRIPVYHLLVELRVSSTTPINLSCQALLLILRNSPALQVLEFLMGVSLPEDGANNIGVLPACFGAHLKTIKIYGFSGKKGEMRAIKFLLQAAPVLETLYVYSNSYSFDSRAGTKRLVNLFDKIDEFPRASEDCEIELE